MTIQQLLQWWNNLALRNRSTLSRSVCQCIFIKTCRFKFVKEWKISNDYFYFHFVHRDITTEIKWSNVDFVYWNAARVESMEVIAQRGIAHQNVSSAQCILSNFLWSPVCTCNSHDWYRVNVSRILNRFSPVHSICRDFYITRTYT